MISEPGPADALAVLSEGTRARLGEYHRAFMDATPFRHVVIDDFLDERLARSLVAEFPPFREAMRNEFGTVSRKVVVTRIRSLGAAYQRIDDAIAERAFLDWLGTLTAIEDVRYDAQYYGGGTHENRHGQELDPHVDFNYHPTSGLHRRLNVIVYLNDEWDERWGGCIEVHANPRDPDHDVSRKYTPIFNRCIIFETHESSWHGFRVIELPEDKRHISRKSLSLYFYSDTRPEDTRAAPHGTFYVPRPLAHVASVGARLDARTYKAIDALIRERDSHLASSHRRELDAAAAIENASRMLAEVRAAVAVPTCGAVVQLREAHGFEADGWVAPSASAAFRVVAPITCIRVLGHAVAFEEPIPLTVRGGNAEASRTVKGRESFEIILPVKAGAGELLRLEFEASNAVSAVSLGSGPDERLLSWYLDHLEA
jgi:Rps23 Pro-64 3,4-dihydroxylase Tpa1-like proline 4-hydroxylase